MNDSSLQCVNSEVVSTTLLQQALTGFWGKLCPLKEHTEAQHSVSMNMTLFGNGLFAHVLSKMRILEWALIQCQGCP